MLDLEVTTPPTMLATDIISVADMKKRLRITHSKLDDVIEDCIVEAVDKLHGIRGELRRSILPTTYTRYLNRWPSGPIPLPLPPLLNVVGISTGYGSPADAVDPDLYVVRTGTIVGEIVLKDGASWPPVTSGPRAIAVEYMAGYETVPPALIRGISTLAAHYFYNNSATVMEPRQIQINRRVEFALDDLRASYGVPHDRSDWGE